VSQELYPGGLFDKSLPKGKVSGNLQVLENGIHFLSTDTSTHIQLPLDQLQIKRGGTNNRLLFLNHPAKPDKTLYTSEHRILREPILQGSPQTSRQLQSIKKSRTAGIAVFLGVLATIILSVIGLIAARGPIAHSIAKKLPPELEEQIGKSAYSQISLEAKLVTDPEIQTQLHDLVTPLLKVLPNDRYEFKFHIFDNPDLNAFAMPGGYVVINSGLLMEVTKPEQVLGVLAHEIAHVTEQHSVRNIMETAGLFIVAQTLFGDMTGLGALITDGGAQLLQKSFSREFEEDADDVGLEFLSKANIDPEGLIELLQILMDEQNKTIYGKAMNQMAWLSTHPTTEKRISDLRKKITELSRTEYSPSQFDLKQFQEKLKDQLTTSNPSAITDAN
jgi:predicted Zn-dependent protease